MFSVFFLFLWLQGQLPHCFHHASHVLVQGANLTTALLEAEYIKRWGVPKMEYAKIFQVIVMFIFIQYNGKPIVRAIPLYGMPWCTQIQMIAMATLCWPVHEMPCFLQVVGPTVRPWRKHCSLLLVLFCSVTRQVVGFYFSTFQMF